MKGLLRISLFRLSLVLAALSLMSGCALELIGSAGNGEVAKVFDFEVTPVADGSDANPGDGVCATVNGTCTLRAAVEEANATPGSQTIGLSNGTTSITGGEIIVTDDVSITGESQGLTTVDAGTLSRFFNVTSGQLQLNSMTLQYGTGEQGGAVLIDGGTGDFRNVTFQYNLAKNGAGPDYGGSLYINSGTANISNSTFFANTAGDDAGDIYAANGSSLTIDNSSFSYSATGMNTGSIYTTGPMTLTNSNFYRGRNGTDSGFLTVAHAVTGGNVLIRNCLFKSGWASEEAGAIRMFSGAGDDYNYEIEDSLFVENIGYEEGGAIEMGMDAGDMVAIRRSTFLRNLNSYWGGGAISSYASGNYNIENSSFAYNMNTMDSGGSGVFSAIGATSSAATFNILNSHFFSNVARNGALGGNPATSTFNLKNTVLANSQVPLAGGGRDTCDPTSTTFASQGYNLIDVADADCNLVAAGEQTGEANMSLLLQRGASTQAAAFPSLLGSLTIDNGTNVACPLTDALGLTRSATCDIGASEYLALSPPTNLRYDRSWYFWALGHSGPNLVPESVSGSVTSYSINPALPAGLSFNANTGAITGVPTEPRPPRLYTIRAHNSAGASAFDMELAVLKSYTVDTTTDATDVSIGDGICATAGGECSLRAAILEASATRELYAVYIPDDTYTITGSRIMSTNFFALVGESQGGTIIDGGNSTAFFDLTLAAEQGSSFNMRSIVGLSDLTVRNFSAPNDENGGAIRRTNGGMQFSHTTFDSNRTNYVSAGAEGGAIYFSTSAGWSLIERSTFNNNQGSHGGAIYAANAQGFLTVQDSSFTSNNAATVAASDHGGALYAGGEVSIRRNLFQGNMADNGGGALYVRAGVSGFIESNTFDNNSSSQGGGVAFENARNPIIVSNNTFYQNSASGASLGGAISAMTSTGPTGPMLVNNIFEGNTANAVADNCQLNGGFPFSIGGNFSDTANTDCQTTATGDQNSLAASLGALQDNGGPTLTRLPGAAAIDDGGVNGFCPQRDQRGQVRPYDSDSNSTYTCDVGATEGP